jgi:hypothetical protein
MTRRLCVRVSLRVDEPRPERDGKRHAARIAIFDVGHHGRVDRPHRDRPRGAEHPSVRIIAVGEDRRETGVGARAGGRRESAFGPARTLGRTLPSRTWCLSAPSATRCPSRDGSVPSSWRAENRCGASTRLRGRASPVPSAGGRRRPSPAAVRWDPAVPRFAGVLRRPDRCASVVALARRLPPGPRLPESPGCPASSQNCGSVSADCVRRS